MVKLATTGVLQAMEDISMTQLFLLHATLVTQDLDPAQHFAPLQQNGIQQM